MRILYMMGVLAVATLSGITIAQDPGYALFTYGQWSLELPLWLFLLCLIILWLIANLIKNTLFAIINIPKRARQAWRAQREKSASDNSQKQLSILTHEANLKRRGQWAEMRALIPHLKQEQLIDDQEAIELEEESVAEHLKLVEDAAAFQYYWNSLSKPLRARPRLVELYAMFLIQTSQYDAAASWLKKNLKRTLQPTWVRLFGFIEGTDESLLKTAEVCLKAYPENYECLICVARHSMRVQLWGRARETLLLSLRQKQTLENHGLLAQLLEQLGDNEESRRHYKQALELELQLTPAFLGTKTKR